ncbi:hypothetical protein Tco_0089291 [Tanacetum coccineum]
MLLNYESDTAYGPDPIRRISVESALAVKIDLTWSIRVQRVSVVSLVESWPYCSILPSWLEDLDGDGEPGFDCLIFALVSSKAHRERCMALRGGFPYCETHLPRVMSAKDTIAVQRCGLSAKELNEFLSSYPIPSEYDVIFPTSTQTIFDAPPGYVGLLNPFGCAKLTNFIIMCKAYGCEPSVDLFRGFFNLCRAGSWLTFQKRSEKHILNLLPKVITRIEGWHERFFFVKDSIISSKYPQLLLDENNLDSKSFKDKLPPNIDENPYFQRLGLYPTSVRVFDDPILFLAGLQPSWEFGQQWSATIVGDSGESPKAGVFVVHPGSVAACIKERKCKTRGGSSRPPVKRKLASGSSSSRVIRAKTSASKDDAPILSICDDDKGLPDCFELKDVNAYHLKISAITPPAWKGHLDNQMDLELLDLHDRCYVIEKMSGEADVIKARERSREEECEELRVKCEAAKKEFDQNPAVLALREKISSLIADVGSLEAEKARLEAVEASLRREVEEIKQDMRDVVTKVIPYAAMELVHSDELGMLVGKLVSSAITYGRYRAYEHKEHTQASNNFATTTFPWLDEFIADIAAPIEALLSKKPPTLQKPTLSRTQMPVPSSQKDTPSSTQSSNLMSPLADLVKPSPSSFE